MCVIRKGEREKREKRRNILGKLLKSLYIESREW